MAHRGDSGIAVEPENGTGSNKRQQYATWTATTKHICYIIGTRPVLCRRSRVVTVLSPSRLCLSPFPILSGHFRADPLIINRRSEPPARRTPWQGPSYELQRAAGTALRHRLARHVRHPDRVRSPPKGPSAPLQPHFPSSTSAVYRRTPPGIRKEDMEKVKLMTPATRSSNSLIHKLSDLNWLILTRQSE